MNRIDALAAPLLVSWQLTRDCDLACLHCCTDSAPNKHLPDELTGSEALRLAGQIVAAGVPYVMLCGGEPLRVAHFMTIAEALGAAGVHLKIETNGQLFDDTIADRLSRLPIRSIQISLDGDTQEAYARQRPGASLARVHAACRAVRAAGMPLEVTFAPTRHNIHEIEAVIDRARALGAFRFNTGRLMRVGRAARLWPKLAPTPEDYAQFRRTLDRHAGASRRLDMEFCYHPFRAGDGLRQSIESPPATLLILPDGRVKMAGILPFVCADVRQMELTQAWRNYCAAWRNPAIIAATHRALADEAEHAVPMTGRKFTETALQGAIG